MQLVVQNILLIGLLRGETVTTSEMLCQGVLLTHIGCEMYKKLTPEKKKEFEDNLSQYGAITSGAMHVGGFLHQHQWMSLILNGKLVNDI